MATTTTTTDIASSSNQQTLPPEAAAAPQTTVTQPITATTTSSPMTTEPKASTQCPTITTVTTTTTPASISTRDQPAPQVPVPVQQKIECQQEATTTQLILSACKAASAHATATPEAEADGASESEVNPTKAVHATLRLPHLREPTKEPEPTDPDFTVRLGAFMARAGEDYFPRLLQKEFPEPNLPPPAVDRARHRFSSSSSSQLSPLSPALSPLATPRECRWSTSSQGGAGVSPRRASLTLRKRRESTQRAAESLVPGKSGSYITQSLGAVARFQRVTRTIRLIVKVCNLLKSFLEQNESEGYSFVEMYLNVQQDMRQDLVFNPHHFTKTHPLNGGPRLEALLAVPPEHRTAHHVQQIISILRSHSGFSDFPVHVQIQMCRAFRYELYRTRRVLLRQGHQPTAFYLLLTGTLMVNIRDVHPSTGHVFIRTVSDLKEGDCFGELALLEQSPRTATIICKKAVELVSLPKEDFDRIIRRPLLEQRDNNIALCRNHLLFQDFPCDIFYGNPEGFFFQYCPAGMTVVKNGHKCAYIVFVKTGKCHLVGNYSTTELTRKRMEAASREVQKAFPLYTEVLKMSSIARKRPGTHPDRRSSNNKDLMEVDLLTMVLGDRHAKTAVKAKRDLGIKVQEYAAPPAPPLQKSRTLSNLFDKLQKERRESLMKSADPGTEAVGEYWARRLQGPVLDKPKHLSVKPDHRPVTICGQNSQRLEFLRTEKEGFAQIAEMTAGDVFGLETLVRRQTSRVSVVSQGAELLFISKKLFLQHANIRVLRIVSDMSITYPNAVDIHGFLKYRREWSRYKHALVRHVVTRIGRTYEPPSCQA